MATDKQAFAARVFNTLNAINVNDHTETKGNLTYLSWVWAWQTLCQHFPDTSYQQSFEKLDDGTVMTYVDLVIADGEESVMRKMWLPVMDNRNNAIKNPDARKISDTYMRCLTKAIALSGLGLYIYAGEDIPQPEKEQLAEEQRKEQQALEDAILSINTAENKEALTKIWEEMPKPMRAKTKKVFVLKAATFEEAA